MRIKNLPSILSMDGSQDALVIEQTDGSEDKSRKVSPAQIKQYVLGNSIDDIYSVMGQNGAKNLIPYPYYRASGYSSNGMTTTYDSDGMLTINKVAGSSTAFFALTYTTDNYCLKPNTKYKLLVEFDNTTQLSVFMKYGDRDIAIINKKSTGKYAVNFTTPQTLEGRENIAIYATASDTETNAKVKVMIMLASDTDDTYQPYAKTNRQLTDDMAIPKYDAANRREYYEGGSAFSGNIDSAPTAGSNNAVASGGTKTYVDNAINTALDNSKIAVFTQTFSNLNIGAAWGSLYVSPVLTIDISSLGLQSAPKTVSIAVRETSAPTVMTVIDRFNASSIKFFIAMPASYPNATVHITVLVVY